MDHDFFETDEGKSWLKGCENLLEKVSKDDTHGDAFLEGAGKEVRRFLLSCSYVGPHARAGISEGACEQVACSHLLLPFCVDRQTGAGSWGECCVL